MKSHRRSLDLDDELNLVPFLDCLVSLIMMLLVSFTALKMGGIYAVTPGQAASATEKKADTRVQLVLQISDHQLKVSAYKDELTTQVGELQRDFKLSDLQEFKKYLSQVVLKYQVGENIFNSDKSANYEQVILVMEAIEEVLPTSALVIATRGGDE